MVYRGRVSNGVVVLEQGATLPDGTAVRIEPVDAVASDVAEDPVYRMGELAVPTGIPDLSLNIGCGCIGHASLSSPKRVRTD